MTQEEIRHLAMTLRAMRVEPAMGYVIHHAAQALEWAARELAIPIRYMISGSADQVLQVRASREYPTEEVIEDLEAWLEIKKRELARRAAKAAAETAPPTPEPAK